MKETKQSHTHLDTYMCLKSCTFCWIENRVAAILDYENQNSVSKLSVNEAALPGFTSLKTFHDGVYLWQKQNRNVSTIQTIHIMCKSPIINFIK